MNNDTNKGLAMAMLKKNAPAMNQPWRKSPSTDTERLSATQPLSKSDSAELAKDLAMATLKRAAPAMNRAQRRQWFRKNRKQLSLRRTGVDCGMKDAERKKRP